MQALQPSQMTKGPDTVLSPLSMHPPNLTYVLAEQYQLGPQWVSNRSRYLSTDSD